MTYEIRNTNGLNDITVNDTNVTTEKQVIYFTCVTEDTMVPKHELQREFTMTHGAGDTNQQINAQAATEVAAHFNSIINA